MRILRRLSDIVSANLNELVETYENPELLLKQAVREMDEVVRAALEDAVTVVAHEKVLARQLADAEAAARAELNRAKEAVRRGNDDDARAALRNKQDHEAASKALAAQLAEAAAAGQALRRQVRAMRLRTEEARRKLTLLAARQRAAQARQRLLREFSAAPIGCDAFDKFERMCRKVERTEAEAEALSELTGENRALELSRSYESDERTIDAELEELRSTCGK